jgi:hypothetical protein
VGNPKDLLKKMAFFGSGMARTLESSPNFNDFIIPSFTTSYTAKKLIAVNLDAEWKQLTDGSVQFLQRDTPLFKDSDGDGISDFMENLIFNNPIFANNQPCFAPKNIDTDGDGIFNQCEDELVSKNPNRSDNNNNGIPDALEILFGLLATEANFDADGDSISDLVEFQNQTPPKFNNNLVQSNFAEQTYSYQSIAGHPDCAKVTITNFRITPGQEELNLGLYAYYPQVYGTLTQFVQQKFSLPIPGNYCFRDPKLPASTCSGGGILFKPEVHYENNSTIQN